MTMWFANFCCVLYCAYGGLAMPHQCSTFCVWYTTKSYTNLYMGWRR